MRKTVAVLLFLTAASAQAQLGDLIRKIDPNKIKKGAELAQAATRDFNEDEEADIGRVVAARILKTYRMSKDDKLQQYVTLVGRTVAAYSARPTLAWHFAVVESDVVNAISAPGGFIFVTTGALQHMKSEAELATVLGHEIAHITQKHVLKEVKRSNLLSKSKDFAQATSGSASNWLNNDFASKIGDIAMDKLLKTGLSRTDENEADKIGVQLADAAGYRAAEFITFLEALAKLERAPAMKQLIATHPSPESRQATVKQQVKGDSGEVLAERWSEYTVNLSKGTS
jgi:predicted Zn-dependent protease